MIHHGLKAEGIHVSINKLCRCFEVPRRTFYYRLVKSAPKVQDRLVTPIKRMLEENTSLANRGIAQRAKDEGLEFTGPTKLASVAIASLLGAMRGQGRCQFNRCLAAGLP